MQSIVITIPIVVNIPTSITIFSTMVTIIVVDRQHDNRHHVSVAILTKRVVTVEADAP